MHESIIDLLTALTEGESAIISELQNESSMRGRLIDLGLIAGTRVKCLQKSASGDLTAYCIRGAVIALRQEDASKILCVRRKAWK